MNGVPGDLFNCNVTFSNTSSSDIQIVMNRYKNDHPPFWAICYCYIQCHNPKEDSILIELPAFSSTMVTLQFKTDSVNPGIAYNSFNIYQIGFAGQVQKLHMTASTTGAGVGIREERQDALSLYPNPANSELHIGSSAHEVYRINDAIGNVLMTGKTSDSGKVEIDITPLTPGVYFVSTDSGLKNKFIKIQQ